MPLALSVDVDLTAKGSRRDVDTAKMPAATGTAKAPGVTGTPKAPAAVVPKSQ